MSRPLCDHVIKLLWSRDEASFCLFESRSDYKVSASRRIAGILTKLVHGLHRNEQWAGARLTAYNWCNWSLQMMGHVSRFKDWFYRSIRELVSLFLRTIPTTFDKRLVFKLCSFNQRQSTHLSPSLNVPKCSKQDHFACLRIQLFVVQLFSTTILLRSQN